MWLTRFSIQRPIIVSMLFIALAVFGVISYSKLGRSLNPNVTFPIVVVSASYPGASPEEMERLVVKPIEDQLDGIDNLDKMTATAQEGRAAVVVQFKLDTNLDFAAIDVQRRVDTARVYMPTDLDPPSVDKSAGSQQSPILELALSSTSISRAALSDLVDRAHPARAQAHSRRPERRRARSGAARVPRHARPAAADRHRAPPCPTSSPPWRRTTPTCPAAGSTRRPRRRTSRSTRRSVRADDMLGIPLMPRSAARLTATATSATSRRSRTATSSSASSRSTSGARRS